MKLEWVKQQLLRRAAQTHQARRRAAVSPHTDYVGSAAGALRATRQSAYVIAESMVPAGCSCLLVGRRTAPPASRTPSMSTSSSTSAAQVPARVAEVRRRIVLAGVTPGTVLRTRASVVEWVQRCRQLPAASEFTVLLRNGRRVAPHSADASLQPLPCGLAASSACARCPWMALAAPGASAAAKQACWRAAVAGAVRNRWAAEAAASTRRDASSARLSHAEAMRLCSFNEPYTEGVTPNRLQGLQLAFVPAGTEEGVGPPTAARVALVREGMTTPALRGSDAADAVGDAARSVAPDQLGRECLLETLEQKRLVPALQRWVTRLPTSVQAQLLGVLVSQPRSPAAARDTSTSTSSPASSLQVVLVAQRSAEVLGMQSPLCAPSHPADLLSTEEQQLVEAVTGAAPLLHEVEVLVCVVDGARDAPGSGGAEPILHVLYPTLCRTTTLEAVLAEGAPGSGGVARSHRPTQAVRCWCPLLDRELEAQLPPYHAALSALPFSWLSDRRFSSCAAPPQPALTSSSSRGEFASAHPLPCVATFWRHPGTLDACCSVLLTVVLGEVDPRSASLDGPRQTVRVELRASRALSAQAVAGLEADVGAAAGQVLLDSALRALVARMTVSADAPHVAHATRHVLVSVRAGDTAASTTALVEGEVGRSSRTRPARFCLYECTARMRPSALSAHVAAVLHHVQRSGHRLTVEAGVVDVDPLASSFVAYACVVLHPSAGTAQRGQE